jgi:hypothetical protein
MIFFIYLFLYKKELLIFKTTIIYNLNTNKTNNEILLILYLLTNKTN